MSRWRPLLALLLAMLCAGPAAAWWEYGHETVATIALRQVRPSTRAAIAKLLARSASLETPTCPARTIAQASVWPDCIKGLGDRFTYAWSWHFVDHDICKPYDPKADCPDGNCVTRQIERAQRLLKDRKVPVRERIMALAFLVHFVGDLHQPLHASEHDDDKGGNDLKVSYGAVAGRTNLHTVWDGYLAERAISTPPGGAAGILAQVPAAERAAMAAGSVEDWARESWQLSHDTAYGSLLGDKVCSAVPPAGRPTLDEAGIRRLLPAVRLQVARGGLRLARLLDEALG